MKETNSIQDLQNGVGNGGYEHMRHHISLSDFDLLPASDGLLDQVISSVPSSSSWPDFSKSQQSHWQPSHDSHHFLSPLPVCSLNSAVDDGAYNFENRSSVHLASRLQQNHNNGSEGGVSAGESKAALMFHRQFSLNRGFTGTGFRSPNVLLEERLNFTDDDLNDGILLSANDTKYEALYNGSIAQPSSELHHVHHNDPQLYPDPNHGAPPVPPMTQGLASTGSVATGGGPPPAQPKQPRARARRGQATDPHSIAERLRRERIAERMKSLQELVPNANKTDKASMLDEIIDYVKFLQLQVKVLSVSRLGGAAAAAPLLAMMSSEGARDSIEGGARSGNTKPASSSSNNSDTMRLTEQQVAKLMEDDMGTAMQYLQGKGLCLMPISLASSISPSARSNLIAKNSPPGAATNGGSPFSPTSATAVKGTICEDPSS
ncbi:unnamed protein product [Cuscuta europaea]|uniref:BHLH domain-containing protein n=1 Tax=Cuscuta europaea TaxID=41803 RepID=A0A9P0ZAZ7_CUSEU|nr:unnamed protein product [Cuscuta europaea]